MRLGVPHHPDRFHLALQLGQVAATLNQLQYSFLLQRGGRLEWMGTCCTSGRMLSFSIALQWNLNGMAPGDATALATLLWGLSELREGCRRILSKVVRVRHQDFGGFPIFEITTSETPPHAVCQHGQRQEIQT